jgi:hypothetical protein
MFACLDAVIMEFGIIGLYSYNVSRLVGGENKQRC